MVMDMIEQKDIIEKFIKDIALRRGEIKEQFLKTWIACNVTDENLTADWLINNVELVERRDENVFVFSIRLKKASE